MVDWYFWVLFMTGVIALLLVDLLVAHRKPHAVKPKEATLWSVIWISLAVAFGVVVLWWRGGVAAQEYFTVYLIEKSLSVDNLFVFVLIFRYFHVPDKYQHKVLFYGVIGAFVFRALFIAAGAALLSKFSWIAFVFGAILLWTAWKISADEGPHVDPAHNPILKFLRRHVRMTDDMAGGHIFVRTAKGLVFTPLLAVLVVVETTDILFAVDSIPASFGVTRDPFLIFTSNAFALLGLRSLYFLLHDLVARFRYLSRGLSIILGVIGLKLIYEELVHRHWLPAPLTYHIPPWGPLLLVAVIMGGAVWLSMRYELRNPVLEARPREGALRRPWQREPSLGRLPLGLRRRA